MKIVFGVDIGGTTVKVGVISYDGKVLERMSIATDTLDNGNNILPAVANALNEYILIHGISEENILGIGIGVPGPVIDGIVSGCVNLGWGKMDVATELRKFLSVSVPIYCGNDATVAGAGEMWMGLSESYKNAVMITLGTGVGGGIIINGMPLDGTNGAAGEIGHMHVDDKHSYRCNCGLKGCLETVASATGVVRLAKEYLVPLRVSSLNKYADLSCKDVFNEAKENDPVALEIVSEVGYFIALAAANIACSIDPEIFIIGGGVAAAGQILINAITEHYEYLAFHSLRSTPFVLATLGTDSGIIGAAYLVISRMKL